ncbi:hypothetical protein [Sphingomonas sp. M1A8_2b]
MTPSHQNVSKSIAGLLRAVASTAALTAGTAALAGCSAASQAPADDAAQVMQSLLSVLTADGKPTCIDSRTRGEPLAIFRAMMTAPAPSRRPLSWFAPRPLRPNDRLSGRPVFEDQIHPDRVVPETTQPSARPLTNLLQSQLNAAATQLSAYQDPDGVSIDSALSAPRATVRWWVRNRLDHACTPVFTASNPVVAKNIAFVSVTAGHWGTTYAFRKDSSAWSPVGQWTNWLY